MTGEKTETRRWSTKRLVITGAAAVAAVALVAGVGLHATFGPNVAPSEYVPRDQPEQVAVNGPAAAAPADADTTQVTDVTADLVTEFLGDLENVRSRATEKKSANVVAEHDQCLADWATAHLAELAAVGTYAVVDVCDRPTAVLAGPAGADSKVLTYGALEETAPARMPETIATSTSNRIAFTAVRSTDGEAQLLATAELPAVEEIKYDGSQSETPPVIHTMPPGFKAPGE